jgi:acyl-CoA synthetase (AMP-forming)/AMP-acid ligase II
VSEIVQRFARIARDQPDRPLIYAAATNEVITASALWHAHLELRKRLSATGLQPDQLVVSAAGNRPASISLFLACLALRTPLMPVDAGSTPTEILEFAERFSASAIVLPKGTDLEIVRHDGDPLDYRQAALLKLTSGSTGLPKATLAAEYHLIADGERIIEAMGIAPIDIQMAAIPLSHAYALGVIVMPLVTQGTAMVLREPFIPQQFLLDGRRFQTRVFPGVPYMFNYFVANPPEDGWPPCLQLLISAGARLDPKTVDDFRARFGIKIHSFYGASETGGIAYDAGDAPSRDGDVGTLMPRVTVSVRPDEAAPPGSGRILVRSASVALGYLGNPDEENDPFIDGGFLTGDYGLVDESGRLTLSGRASVAVNVAGRKVHPAEVERVLRGMAGIDDVCVIAAPDRRRGQQIVACVATEKSLSAMEVRQFCAASLAPYKLPRLIIFLRSLPTTSRGKIDHATLLALALEQLNSST